MSHDPECPDCGELYEDGFSDTHAKTCKGQVLQLGRDVAELEEKRAETTDIVAALVAYIESREWVGISRATMISPGAAFAPVAQCEACKRPRPREAWDDNPKGEHRDDCAWLALMRAAGRR